MEFSILGPLEARHDGRPLALGGKRQRALLALLLMHANEVVSSDRLIDALWEGAAPADDAARTLQVTVSRLRKVLEPDRPAGEPSDVLVTRSPGYVIEISDGQLDARRFEALVAEGQAALDAGDPALAAERLREALSLWRGPPLADLAYETFAQGETARLEELRLRAIEARLQADLDCGRGADLVAELESLVTAHPLRERLRAQLMLALYRSGRQAEALEAYREARGVLVDELGVEPGRELQRLERSILTQDQSLDAVAASVEPDEAGHPGRVFVGRGSELERLRAGLDDAIAGRGGLFLLVGEPGIGKSHLADELMRQADACGAQVLVGRCWEAGGAPAYWPWVQSIRALAEHADPDVLRAQLSAGAADIAQIVPELRELFPDLAEPSLDTEGARFRLFDSVCRFLRNAAAKRPLVLVLDDLHAADEPSLLLLRFLASELDGARMLVVGTYRDVDPTIRDPLAGTLAELARHQVTHRIVLSGLAKADIERYIELSAGAPSPQGLTAAIHSETEGNPLFVGEMVRLLDADGRLSEADVERFPALGIPQGVREVIGRRLGRLSDECRNTLTLASVIGREFSLDALGRVSDLQGDALLDVLDEAVEARVITSVPDTPGRLRFAHALIRETLYEGLTTLRRVQLHRRAGEALEALYGRDADPHLAELAHHAFEAAPGGDVAKAIDYAQRAGERAIKLLAYEEAARFFALALQALDLTHSVDSPARCDLLLALGDAHARAGNTPVAKETFVAAADLARETGLREHLAQAALGYAGRFPWLRAGLDDRLVPLLEEALAALGDDESALRVRVLGRLAGALRDEPSLEPRSSLAREAVEIARKLDDPDTLAFALVSLATAAWGPDPTPIAAIADEVRGLADATGDAERAFQACWLHHIAWLTRGETDRVAALVEEHRVLAERLKQPSQRWYSAVLRSDWALFRGEYAEAERLAEDALQLGERAQSWDAGFSYRLVLFFLRRDQGRLEEIQEGIRQSVHEYAGYRLFRPLVSLLDLELGRDEAARAAFNELARDDFSFFPRDGEWLFCLSILGEVAAWLRDTDRAQALYTLLLPYAGLNALATAEATAGPVARYLGLLASAAEQWDDAARHFEDALDMSTRMGARPWVSRTQCDLVQMLSVRGRDGDGERADALAAEAEATAAELGLQGVRERLNAAARGGPTRAA